MKNIFYAVLKTHFIMKHLIFCQNFFDYVGKRLISNSLNNVIQFVFIAYPSISKYQKIYQNIKISLSIYIKTKVLTTCF